MILSSPKIMFLKPLYVLGRPIYTQSPIYTQIGGGAMVILTKQIFHFVKKNISHLHLVN